MSIFTLVEISQLGAPKKFYKLYRNNKCLFDKFRDKYDKTQYAKSIASIDAMIDDLSNGREIPPAKMKELTNRAKGDNIRDFELRCGRVRVYYFIDPNNGSIIVLGNIKEDKTQNDDIITLRKIKNEYINSTT